MELGSLLVGAPCGVCGVDGTPSMTGGRRDELFGLPIGGTSVLSAGGDRPVLMALGHTAVGLPAL